MVIDLDDPFLSVNDVAKIFNVRPYAVRQWLKDGKLKGVKIESQWRVQKSVVIKFAQDAYGEAEE